MAPDSRIYDAFSAMKDLGISSETVRPVLKNMLRLYDNQWELIEEENYRALIEAIFEQDEAQPVGGKRKGDARHDVSTLPCKRLHSGEQDDQASSPVDISKSVPTSKKELQEGNTKVVTGQDGSKPHLGTASSGEHKRVVSKNGKPVVRLPLDKDKIPQNLFIPRKNVIKPFKPSQTKGGIQPNSSLPDEQCNDGGTSIVSSQMASKEIKSHPRRESNTANGNYSMNNNINNCPSFSRKQTVATKTSRATYYAGFSSKPHSDALVASSSGNNCMKATTSQHSNAEKNDSPFSVASSLSGEVKLSVDFNSIIGKPNFSIPNLDEVIKRLENKYLNAYKILGNGFSVKKLLNDFCIGYLELGTDSTNRSVALKSSPVLNDMQHNRGAYRTDDISQDIDEDCYRISRSRSSEDFHQRDKEQPVSCIRDITNGLEKREISLVDNTGNEPVPKFVYIPQNLSYEDAHVRVSLARIGDDDCCLSCSGNCLSSSIPCACARETDGEFAYTPRGLLKEKFLDTCISMSQEPQNHHPYYCQPAERCKCEVIPGPCKGHSVRKFIKECWRKCGCHLSCGNRVVQRGITCELQVFLTQDGKGWGVRALHAMPKGAFVCEYVGEILTNTELYVRNNQLTGNERHTFPVLLNADCGAEAILNDEEALCLDATYYGNVARFINHRCYDSNLLEIPVAVETPDHHYYHIAFFTKREIPAMEELTWDYGIDFSDEDHPVKAFQCCCGSAFCRGIAQKNNLLAETSNGNRRQETRK